MSTTSPPSASETSSSTISTTNLPSSIPYFTPDHGCLDPTNIWYGSRPCDIGTGLDRKPGWCDGFLWDYFGGTAAPPTSELATKECYPQEGHVATRCPESYTAAGSSSSVSTDDNGNEILSKQTLFCCPEVYSFDMYESFTLDNHDGEAATVDVTNCVAKTPSFPGNNPHVLTVSSWASDSEGMPKLTTKTASYDTKSQILLASVIEVTYEVMPSLNATCVPDCENPWTGGEWPVPTTEVPYVDPGDAPNDSSLRGALPAMIGGITAGSVVGAAILVGVACCLVRSHRKKKRARVASVQFAAEEKASSEGKAHVDDTAAGQLDKPILSAA